MQQQAGHTRLALLQRAACSLPSEQLWLVLASWRAGPAQEPTWAALRRSLIPRLRKYLLHPSKRVVMPCMMVMMGELVIMRACVHDCRALRV